MISIIICSRSKVIDPDLLNNIQSTIGVPFETIVIDNSTNIYSIFNAYNKGVSLSQFPLLCFIHDDINLKTNNWGMRILDHFNDSETGAIGIAGSPYSALMPGSWWAGELVNINIVPWNAENGSANFSSYPKTTLNKNQVITLDGVWFCIKKELFECIKFDDESFSGFHFYDIDISMQINKLGYKLYCVFDILIEHFSKGDMNINWIENAFIINKKWQRQLPITCVKLTYTEQCEAELKTLKEMVMVMLQNKQSKKDTYTIAFKQLRRFYRGYFYPPIIMQLGKYLIGSIVSFN